MRLKLWLLAVASLLLFAPQSRAENCNASIFDQAGVIHNPQIIANASRTLINQGADVKVVIVDSISRYGSNLTDVESYFERTCTNWVDSSGQRKANLFVVMVAPTERAKNIFLGSYYNGAFDITPTYSRLSNSYFKDRQWELGIASVLQGTTNLALNFRKQSFTAQQREYTMPAAGTPRNTPVQTADTGMSGLAIFFIVLLVMSGIGIALYFIFRESPSSSTTYPDPGLEPTSYTPYRSRAAAAGTTTVINNNSGSGDGFVSGLVVGEMLNRPSTVYVEPSAPTYVEPAPSYTPAEPEPSSAPDSTWEDTSSSSSGDSGDSGGSSDSGFGGDSGGGSSDSSF